MAIDVLRRIENKAEPEFSLNVDLASYINGYIHYEAVEPEPEANDVASDEPIEAGIIAADVRQNVTESDNIEYSPISQLEEKTPQINGITFDAAPAAINGLKRAFGAFRGLKKSLANVSESVIHARDIANIQTGKFIGFSKEVLTAPEHKTTRRAALALGGLVVAYAAYKGLAPQRHSQHIQEALPTAPKAPAAHHTEVLNQVQAAPKAQSAEAVRSAGKAASAQADQIYVKPGEGISQTIRDAFPGKTAGQYGAAAQAATVKFGNHVIEGISKYKMSDGSFGLSHAGKAHFGPHVREFLGHYLNTRR